MSDMNWWPRSPLGVAMAVAGAMVLLYLGRSAAHGAAEALSGTLQRTFATFARLLMSSHERLSQRNREVLLSMGREDTERLIEREFERVHSTVARDLSGYPALHRRIADQIQRIDEDYRESSEVPPAPPEWVHAVEAVAGIPSNGDAFVGRILGDIHKTLTSAYAGAMTEYRKASAMRHRLLSRMLPFWRRLDRELAQVDGTIRGLDQRSLAIDRQMEMYEEIRAGSDDAARILSSSTVTHFISSALVLAIALMGAFINFHLIALPMSEMVGASSHVGSLMVSDIAALVIILIEIAMGLFLMESLRVTRLFPVIGMLDDVMRKRLAWVAFFILLTLAGVEASLAYMRDMLAADSAALAQSLSGGVEVAAEFRWIPAVGQMVMGFMLPFALTFVAIPLESFIRSARTVTGTLLAFGLRASAGVMELLGAFSTNLGSVLTFVYDLLIVVPLRVEEMWTKRSARSGSAPAEPHPGGVV
ncbi:MAG: hypothetical protein JRG82_00105 [Deltaproteobacteria bacterium]|nr:hypothetical protein [Deltaproteobacteria bacterium]